jgi:signal transduction histidine kinase
MDELLLFKGILWGSVALLILLGGSFLMFVKYERDKVKAIEDKARRELEFQREIRQAEMEIGEETKSQIARDLHDTIGHSLSLMRIVHEQIRSTSAATENVFIEMDSLIDKASNEVRTVSRTLNADFLKSNDFSSSIQIELDRLARIHPAISISFKKGISVPDRYTNDQLLMAYRIFQEALTNALKHADANQIAVKCWADNTLLHLSDNGKGFERANQGALQANGIRNMFKRSELVNLTMQLESKIGEGTQISIK